MKKNKILVLGLVAAFVAVLSLTLVSGTWAKYTSTVTGSDEARVAKWAIDYTGKTEGTTLKVDLFKEIKDSNGTDDETDVKQPATSDTDQTKVIAPGTKGTTTITLTNKSEVTAKVTVKLDLTKTGFTVDGADYFPIKLYAKVGDGERKEIFTSGTTETLDAVTLAIPTSDSGTSTNVVIDWEWAFPSTPDTTTDNKDTKLGEAATAPTLKLDVTATFEQVD